jgi:ABC-type phosphate transport system substrate-binding protein
MRTRYVQHQLFLSIACILLCLLFLSLSGASSAAPAETAENAENAENAETIGVYINKDAPSSELSDAVLRSIFSMRLTLWPDGTRIQVVVLGDAQPLHRRFCKSILGMFPYQLRQLWDRGVFSGTGEAPLQASDEKQMLEILKTTPGAIGYLLQKPETEGIHFVKPL